MEIVVNHRTVDVDAGPTTRLLDVLRHHLGLLGTKEGCGRGECGSCTVLVDGEPQPSCLLLAARVGSVETIESVEAESERLRQALADKMGFQCGFCTPGLVMTVVALIRSGRRPDDAELRKVLTGNICRCTGYQAIVEAVREVLDVKVAS